MSKNKIYLVMIIFVLIVGIIVMCFYYQNINFNQEVKLLECEDNLSKSQAEIFISFNEWGENYYNSDEIIFSFWVYNFGNKEAKNVNVRCVIEKEGVIIKSITKNIGNVASRSYSYEEIILYSGFREDWYGYCYEESCDECRLLHREIPSLLDTFGGEVSYEL